MDLKNFNLEPFNILDKEWALLTAGNKDKFNTMTISWGGFGTIWHKPVVTVYVRPNRYTYEFIENSDYFTISFFDEKFKDDLAVLGSKSGRDLNKLALTKITPNFVEKGISFDESYLTIVCKKIYFQDINLENIIPEERENISLKLFNNQPVHRMYIGEVVEIIDGRK